MTQPPRNSYLVSAVEEGDVEKLLQRIKEYRHLLNVKCQGRTPLHEAARRGELEMIKVLIEHGADININDFKYRRTPLHYAVMGNQPEALELLLRLGADIDEKDIGDFTAPQLALHEQCNECVKFFLTNIEDVVLKKPTLHHIDKEIREEMSDLVKEPSQSEDKTETCKYCADNLTPALFTFEPCGCKISCLKHSLQDACKNCGKEIEKVSYKKCSEMKNFNSSIENMKNEIAGLHRCVSCPICWDRKIECSLNCGHLYCIQCVKTLGTKTSANTTIFMCSNCRKESFRYHKIYLN